jgi:hypothetical protein
MGLWLFAGSDASCFRTVAGAPGTSTSNGLDAGWSNVSMTTGSGGRAAADFTDASTAAKAVGIGETLWFHAYREFQNGHNAVFNPIEICDSAGQPWLAIRYKSGGSVFGLFYNSGTGGAPVWSQLGVDFSHPPGSNYVIDIAVTLGAPHSVSLYLNLGAGSALNQSATFVANGFTNALMAILAGQNGTTWWGGVLVSEGIPTIEAHCSVRYPTGAGNTNTFTVGTFAEIDENGISDADLMSSNTAGQRATFVYGDMPALPAGYAMGDTFLFTRAKNDGGAIGNVKPVHRPAGGPDAVGASFAGMGLTFGPFLKRYNLTKAQFDGSEFGFESAA